MNKYSKMLAEQHSLSRLCVDREKIETDDILGVVLTIEDCDVAEDVKIQDEQTTFSVFTFKEFPGKFVYGGLKLTEIAKDIIKISENDRIAIDKMEIQIMLKRVRTKGGNDFTDVQFV